MYELCVNACAPRSGSEERSATKFVPAYNSNPLPLTSNRMRRTFASLLLVFLYGATNAAPSIEGVWLTCVPEAKGRRNPFNLLSIEREGTQYVVREEWGSYYAFRGIGTRVGNTLIVRGCDSYQGEHRDGCNPDNPPIARKIKLPLPSKTPSSIAKAFRQSQPIKVPGHAWQTIASQCEAYVGALEEKGETPK